MRYYRFENYDNELGKVVGGYISLICAMLLMNLDLPADAGDDDYENALAEVKDPCYYRRSHLTEYDTERTC